MSFLLCFYRHLLILRTIKLIHNWIVGMVSRGVGPYIDRSPYRRALPHGAPCLLVLAASGTIHQRRPLPCSSQSTRWV